MQGEAKPIADMESFGLSFDNGVEEWTPMEQGGWMRRLMTSKSVTVSLAGKRCYGDEGNDYVASKAHANGNDAGSVLQMVFPDGSRLEMPCVLNVTASGGGDSTAVAALEFEAMSDGRPTFTEAPE